MERETERGSRKVKEKVADHAVLAVCHSLVQYIDSCQLDGREALLFVVTGDSTQTKQ